MKPIFHSKAWLVEVCLINAKSLDKEKKNLCFWKPSNFILFITFEPFHKLESNHLSISGKDYYTFKRSQSCYQHVVTN